MNAFNTPLPGFVLADLFRNSLIDLADKSPDGIPSAKEATAEIPIRYTGKNQHRITIGVYFAEQAAMPDEQLQFLVSILKACQRSLDHVALVNFAERELALHEIVAQLQPYLMLLFGPHHVFGKWMMETEDFAPFYLQNVQVVRIPVLETMLTNTAESRALKGKFWLTLKQLFQL